MRIGFFKKCRRCKKRFRINSNIHYYCGSAKKKKGCSYLQHKKKKAEWEKRNEEKRRIRQNTSQRRRLGWTEEEIKNIKPNPRNKIRLLRKQKSIIA